MSVKGHASFASKRRSRTDGEQASIAAKAAAAVGAENVTNQLEVAPANP
jgi:hypothetical protein